MAALGITGLTKERGARTKLIRHYLKILRLTRKFPSHYAYKLHTEAIINHRLSIVKETEDEKEIEKKICNGRIEFLVRQARAELELLKIMLVNKAWEPLIEEPPLCQWTWPPVLE